MQYGPSLAFSQELHAEKYRGPGEGFDEAMYRISAALKDDDTHFHAFNRILRDMRFLPAGRVQAAMGAPRAVTPYNCFVMDTIDDSMSGIMRVATEAAETMRMGGGVGYDFSTLRPSGSLIKSLQSKSDGPVSFMGIFDAVCSTIKSAGHRRGAQMGVLRVDHPDIERFVNEKQNSTKLTNFNISIAVTDEFMQAVAEDGEFNLQFEGTVYSRIKAAPLYEKIMRSTWDWAEPGILFIDTINRMNNLWYCEKIAATNPCAEQPLPPYGACLLGSFNLVKYLMPTMAGMVIFDWKTFRDDIAVVVRAMDNVVDRAVYPLAQQRSEATNKRRMGLGITGLANAAETIGHPYASSGFLDFMDKVLRILSEEAYTTSCFLADEKGAFALFDRDKYLQGSHVQSLPITIRDRIHNTGIRNSHLTSIAPCGTISLAADNVSSSIEPVFSLQQERTVRMPDGDRVVEFKDYAYRVFGTKGRTSDDITAKEHVGVLSAAQRHVDSAVSKTCNVNPSMPWEEFKDIYMSAWKAGCKGITTFNPGGKRFGIMKSIPEVEEGSACYIGDDGTRKCE